MLISKKFYLFKNIFSKYNIIIIIVNKMLLYKNIFIDNYFLKKSFGNDFESLSLNLEGSFILTKPVQIREKDFSILQDRKAFCIRRLLQIFSIADEHSYSREHC